MPRFVVEQRVFASWILALSASLAAWACACGFFSLNDVVPQRADGGPPADARVDAPPADASDGRPPTDCDGGLLAHWTFDEGDGGTVHDTSGNGNDGTFGATPPAWAPGHKGSAVVFARNDAGSEYVNLGSQQVWDIPGAMTVAAWMNLGQQDGDQHLVGKRNQTGCYGQVSWSLGVEMGSSFFQVPLPGLGCTPQRASGPSLPLGQWVHVAGVFRPRQEIDFYQDGVLRQSFATDAGVQGVNYENGAAMRLGSNPGPLGKSDPEQFVGALDEVYVWACALSAEQIAQLAAQ
ncbi:MAG TPA: LamG domain-containing protein [Polyangiaceae bacterium]|nr:LamG domain-containing protein [Polyangiaceae bacterium]